VQPRRVAATLVLGEGVAGVGAGIGFVVAALVGHPADRGVAVFLGVLLAVYGAGVVLVGRGLWRARSWPRTPAYLVQFFGLVVAYYQRHTLPVVTIVLAVVCIVTGAALVRAESPRE
jgi:hypothetical protein